MKYQLLPPLSQAEYEALRDDITGAGIRQPIDVDEAGEILDGHHRKQIADELGIECPERVVRGLQDFEKADYALTVNAARRHLDRDGKRELVKASLKLHPRLSDREHARRCGASHSTVSGIRAAMEAAGQLDTSPSRQGGDGKEYPRQVANLATSIDRPSEGEAHAGLDADAHFPRASAEADGADPPDAGVGAGSASPAPETAAEVGETPSADGPAEAGAPNTGAGPAPIPAVLTSAGVGVTPDHAERKNNRRPLTDAFRDAAWDLTKNVERLERLVLDDRFPRNAEQVARMSRNDLLRARDLLAAVIDRVPNLTREFSE